MMKNLFRTNRDVIAYISCMFWIICNFACFFIGGIALANISTYLFLLYFVVLIIIDKSNKNFHNWLNNDVKQRNN